MRIAIVFLLLAHIASAQQPPRGGDSPKITLGAKGEPPKPIELTAAVGELVRLTSSEPKARWELAPGTEGADLEPGTEGRATFAASRAGRYLAINYVCEKPAAWASIVVGGSPVVPPGPTPKPPQPNTLTAKLLAAIEKDGGLTDANRQALALLKALCGQARTYAGKPEIVTTGQFVSVVATASRSIASDAIPEVRKWLVGELRALVGESDVPLTEVKRTEIAAAMTRLETSVQEVLK
jgi:hypothetical protein